MRFEELEKKCRRYHLKKAMRFVTLLAVVAGGIYGGYVGYIHFYAPKKQTVHAAQVQKTTSPSLQIKSESKNIENPEPLFAKKEIKHKCYALQFLTSTGKYYSKVIQLKKRLEREGLSCYIKSDGNSRYIFVRCNASYTQNELVPLLQRSKNEDVMIVKEECRFVSAKPSSPKFLPERKTQPPLSKIAAKSTPSEQTDIEKPSLILEAKPLSVQKLEQLFAKRQSYGLALQIARMYLQKKEFSKALMWAKKANNIDREKEGAWIAYAKALYGLGKKQKARRLLQIYLDFKESQKVKKVLKEMQ